MKIDSLIATWLLLGVLKFILHLSQIVSSICRQLPLPPCISFSPYFIFHSVWSNVCHLKRNVFHDLTGSWYLCCSFIVGFNLLDPPTHRHTHTHTWNKMKQITSISSLQLPPIIPFFLAELAQIIQISLSTPADEKRSFHDFINRTEGQYYTEINIKRLICTNVGRKKLCSYMHFFRALCWIIRVILHQKIAEP